MVSIFPLKPSISKLVNKFQKYHILNASFFSFSLILLKTSEYCSYKIIIDFEVFAFRKDKFLGFYVPIFSGFFQFQFLAFQRLNFSANFQLFSLKILTTICWLALRFFTLYGLSSFYQSNEAISGAN